MEDLCISSPELEGEDLTDETGLARSPRRVRARSESRHRYSKTRLAVIAAEYPEDTRPLRPRDRNECRGGHRPCPFVSCQHHLYLDINEHTGSIKFNFPHLEVWELPESCALDVADRGETILDEVGAKLNLTRERTRQLEARALRALHEETTRDMSDYTTEGFDAETD